MEKSDLQRRETLILEAMLSGLDARESAKGARSPMLIYLADLLVERARQELDEIRMVIERLGESAGTATQPPDRDVA